MRLWTQKYALTALCFLATLFAGGIAQAEGEARVTKSQVPTARVDFLVTVPHFLDIRLSPSTGRFEETSALLEKVRNGGSRSRGSASTDATALRVDGVRIASNRGQVMVGMRSDEVVEAGLPLRGVSDEQQQRGPRSVLRAVAFVAEGRPGLRETGALAAPNRAGVTQVATAWLRAYSREPGLMPAVARAQPAHEIVPTATYIAVVP
jgi:hypothetical protein